MATWSVALISHCFEILHLCAFTIVRLLANQYSEFPAPFSSNLNSLKVVYFRFSSLFASNICQIYMSIKTSLVTPNLICVSRQHLPCATIPPSSPPSPPSRHPLPPPLAIPYHLAISEVKNTCCRVSKKHVTDERTEGRTEGPTHGQTLL